VQQAETLSARSANEGLRVRARLGWRTTVAIMEVMSECTRRLPLDAATLRHLPVELSVHPRSLRNAFLGGLVRGVAGHRIRAGLAARNLLHLAPQLQAPRGTAEFTSASADTDDVAEAI
jgi:hypothetical protein